MKRFSCFLPLLYGEVKGQVQTSIPRTGRDSVFCSGNPLLGMNLGPPVGVQAQNLLFHFIPVASIKSEFTTLKQHAYDVNIRIHQMFYVQQLILMSNVSLSVIICSDVNLLKCQDIFSMTGPGSNTLLCTVSPITVLKQLWKVSFLNWMNITARCPVQPAIDIIV